MHQTLMTEYEKSLLSEIRNKPETILRLNAPSTEFIICAAMLNPRVLNFITNQPMMACILVAKLYGQKGLQYIKVITPEIRTTAAKPHGIMKANLSLDEIEMYTNACNVAKWGAQAYVTPVTQKR